MKMILNIIVEDKSKSWNRNNHLSRSWTGDWTGYRYSRGHCWNIGLRYIDDPFSLGHFNVPRPRYQLALSVSADRGAVGWA